MSSPLMLTFAHLVVAGLPVIAALWGMTLVAYGYEWRRYQSLLRGARLARARTHWLVIEQGRAEDVCRVRCQELIVRRYSCRP